MEVSICGECGFKDEPFEDKCPKCKSPYVVWNS
jgi:ribonucleoside-triphosphate reductase